MRLKEQGWIGTQWGVSETKRQVKFYSATKGWGKQLSVGVANWSGQRRWLRCDQP